MHQRVSSICSLLVQLTVVCTSETVLHLVAQHVAIFSVSQVILVGAIDGLESMTARCIDWLQLATIVALIQVSNECEDSAQKCTHFCILVRYSVSLLGERDQVKQVHG